MKTPNFWKKLSVGEKAAWIGVFGLAIVALLAFILPRIFPEKQLPTYYSSGNSGDSVQGNGNILDKSTKNFYGDTNKPMPHFIFSVSTAKSDLADLTNNFLAAVTGEKHYVPGCLYIPIDDAERSNLTLNIWARNDSATTVEDVEVGIFVPKDWQCVPDAGWMQVKSVNRVGNIVEPSPNKFITNAFQIWICHPRSTLLAGDGFETPSLHLDKIPMNAQLNGTIAIVAKTKNSPAGSADSAISFRLCVWPNSIFASNDFYRPFVATNMEALISPEKLKQLQN